MRRALLLFILAVCFGSVYSQVGVYHSVGVGSVKGAYTYDWEQFATLDCAVFVDNGAMCQYGVTYGMSKLGGWYASAMMGTGMHYKYDGTFDGNSVPHLTGRMSRQALSLSAGGSIRIVIPLYFYAGLGYLYRTNTYETETGDWLLGKRFEWKEDSKHYFLWEAGFAGNIRGCRLSLGVVMSTWRWFDLGIKFGVGYMFPLRMKGGEL